MRSIRADKCYVGGTERQLRSGALSRTSLPLGALRVLLCLLIASALVGWIAGFQRAGATFTASTSNGVNAFAAATLGAPSAVSLAHGCATSATSVSFLNINNGGGPTPQARDLPSGGALGDVAMAIVVLDNTSTISVSSSNASQWKQYATTTNGAFRVSIFYAVMQASNNPGTTTWTASTSGNMYITIALYRGVDTADPVDVHLASANDSTNKTVPANGVTTTRNNGVVLAFFALRLSNATGWGFTPSAPGTARAKDIGTTNMSIYLCEIAQATAGTTANYAGTPANTSPTNPAVPGIGWQIALKHGSSDIRVKAEWTGGSGASGHELERLYGTTSQKTMTVTPATTTNAVDAPLPLGGTYRYNVRATAGAWKSAAATASVFADCGSRLTNGGFEQATTLSSPWACGSPTGTISTSPANANNGNNSLSMPSSATCSQAVPLTAGTTYKAVLFVKGGGSVTIGYRTVSGGTVTLHGTPLTATVDSAYTRIVYDLTPLVSQSSAQFYVTTDSNGTRYVDDVFIA